MRSGVGVHLHSTGAVCGDCPARKTGVRESIWPWLRTYMAESSPSAHERDIANGAGTGCCAVRCVQEGARARHAPHIMAQFHSPDTIMRVR